MFLVSCSSPSGTNLRLCLAGLFEYEFQIHIYIYTYAFILNADMNHFKTNKVSAPVD